METNEIIENEDVVETTEEIAAADQKPGLEVVVGFGLIAFAGVVIYKRIIKPLMAKTKTGKDIQAEATVLAEEDVFENNDVANEHDETE